MLVRQPDVSDEGCRTTCELLARLHYFDAAAAAAAGGEVAAALQLVIQE
jgi:hypothetical protein